MTITDLFKLVHLRKRAVGLQLKGFLHICRLGHLSIYSFIHVSFCSSTDPGHVTDVEVKSYPDGESIGLKWIKPPGIISYMEVFVEPYQKGKRNRTTKI